MRKEHKEEKLQHKESYTQKEKAHVGKSHRADPGCRGIDHSFHSRY